MELYDQHMHTYFSYDAEEKFETYLKLNDKFLVTTEHFDLSNPVTKGHDDVPDYAAYSAKIDELNEKYNHRILKGIEVGYVEQDVDRINAYLADKPFDVTLLSVHHNGRFDYMDDFVADMDAAEIIKEYYTELLDAVEAIESANILAHFEYGVRVLPVDVETFKTLAEPFLIPLFKKVIEHGLALEINSKSIWKYNNLSLYEYAVPLYISLGGKKFSIGSDAHTAADYEGHFDEAIDLLKRNGINETCLYQNGNEISVAI
jgi:histidinol-phosphatase (PHP family)